MTTDLAEWLLAQIAEDERVAQAAAVAAEGKEWRHPEPHLANTVQVEVQDAPNVHLACDPDDDDWYPPLVYDEGACPDEAGEHIARWDPARVIAECDAKRRIVERHKRWNEGLLTLLDIASVYADRPGYREEWRP